MRRSYDHTGAFQESLFGHAFHDVTTSFAAGIDGEITPTGHPPRCVQAGSRMDLPSPAPPRPGTPDPAMMGTIGACASGRADRAAGCSSAR
jgi:hypothetical protein